MNVSYATRAMIRGILKAERAFVQAVECGELPRLFSFAANERQRDE